MPPLATPSLSLHHAQPCTTHGVAPRLRPALRAVPYPHLNTMLLPLLLSGLVALTSTAHRPSMIIEEGPWSGWEVWQQPLWS